MFKYIDGFKHWITGLMCLSAGYYLGQINPQSEVLRNVAVVTVLFTLFIRCIIDYRAIEKEKKQE